MQRGIGVILQPCGHHGTCAVHFTAACRRAARRAARHSAVHVSAAGHEPIPAADFATIASAHVRGAALYKQHCALCHGAKGLGDGQMAKLLNPPPRGLVSEPWRYLDASSPERLRESMAGLLRTGLPQAGMPGISGQVTDAEVAQLVQFVLALRR